MMQVIMWVLGGGFILLWLFLLLECSRRRFGDMFGNSPNTRAFWLITFVFVNPLLTLWYVLFGRSGWADKGRTPKTITISLVSLTIVAGFVVNFAPARHLWLNLFTQRQSADRAGNAFSAHAATIVSQHQTSFSHSSTQSGQERFAARHVLLTAVDQQPLTQKILTHLKQFLLDISYVETVTVIPDPALPPRLQTKPDIFLNVELQAMTEKDLLISRQLDADIHVSMGQAPWSSRSHYSDHLSLPIIRFYGNVSLHHHSTTTGIETSKYNLAARDIAQNIADSLQGAWDKWINEKGLLPELPDYLHGRYQNTALPELFHSYEPAFLTAYAGLLKHYEGYYVIDATPDPCRLLHALTHKLQHADWYCGSSTYNDSILTVHCSKDSQKLTVFRASRGEQDFSTLPEHLHICHEVLFTDDERRQVLQRLLNQERVETIVLFERMMQGPLRQRLFDLLRGKQGLDPSTQIMFTDLCLRFGDHEQARQSWHKSALRNWLANNATFKNRLEEQAKKLEIDYPDNYQPDSEMLTDLGAVEITADRTIIDTTVALHEPVIIFRLDQQGEMVCHSLTILPPKTGNENNPDSLLLKFFDKRPHQWSTNTQSLHFFTPQPKPAPDITPDSRTSRRENIRFWQDKYVMDYQISTHDMQTFQINLVIEKIPAATALSPDPPVLSEAR